MSLLQNIKNAQIQARKVKNEAHASALTTLIGEASMIGKNAGNRDTTDAEVMTVIKKFIKNIDETTDILSKNQSENQNKINSLREEKNLLQSFLPTQMSEEDIKIAIKEIIANMNVTGPKAMGLVMKEMKNKYDGTYDGALVSKISKELLN